MLLVKKPTSDWLYRIKLYKQQNYNSKLCLTGVPETETQQKKIPTRVIESIFCLLH